MPKIIKTTNTKGGTNKSRYRGEWGRGGKFLHIKINTFLVQEQFAQASKREREALNVGVCSPLQLQAQYREGREGRDEGGGERREEKPTT